MEVFKTAVISLSGDFKYFAEVMSYYDRYFYQVDNVAIEIKKYEYEIMTGGRWHVLAYFHTVLRLHFLIIEKKKNPNFIRDLSK